MSEEQRRFRTALSDTVSALRAEARERGLGSKVTIRETPAKDGVLIVSKDSPVPFLLSASYRPVEVVLADAIRLLDVLAEPNPLERFRLRYELSYPALAKRLGISVALVHAYCSDVNSPPAYRREEIAEKTGGEVAVDAEWPLPVRGPGRPRNK